MRISDWSSDVCSSDLSPRQCQGRAGDPRGSLGSGMFGRGTKDMATVEKMPMLAEGHAKLTADLKRLKEERPQIVDAIEEARENGDLSENAEYSAAKDRPGQFRQDKPRDGKEWVSKDSTQ